MTRPGSVSQVADKHYSREEGTENEDSYQGAVCLETNSVKQHASKAVFAFSHCSVLLTSHEVIPMADGRSNVYNIISKEYARWDRNVSWHGMRGAWCVCFVASTIMLADKQDAATPQTSESS